MHFEQLAQTSETVAATAGKKKKTELIAALLQQLAPQERAPVARFLSGETGHKTGIGYATVKELRAQAAPASAASLTISEVDAALEQISRLEGAGSLRARKHAFGALLARGTASEHSFLSALVLGELRQGALDALVVEAIAKATGLEAKRVRTAYMLAGDLGRVAAGALGEGAACLAQFGLTVFRPVLPMLAQTAEDVAEALASLEGPAVLEHKIDGFRVQIHKRDDEVRIYSRALNDLTATLPEVVAMARALPARELILDGEAIALGPTGRPLPFQDTMQSRAKNRPAGTALSLTLFDALMVDGQTLLSTAARERFALLDGLAPKHRAPRVITSEVAEANAFYDAAIAGGHEGVMVKALESTYDAGNRGAAWLKVKKVRRADLVVTGVEWGSGRRTGKLSNLHLAARDPKGGFVMVSKTFKGMTDEVLAWQTTALQAIEVDRDGHVVFVRPELVVEIAFNDVQRSSQYPGGVALRFARLVRYRDDKTAAEADTIDAVRAIAIAAGVLSSTM